MGDDLKWLIGLGATLSVGWGGMLVASFRNLLKLIRRTDEAAQMRDNELHARVNRVREDTVHKSDLTDVAMRLDGSMKEMRDEHRAATTAVNARLDALLAAIANRNNGERR